MGNDGVGCGGGVMHLRAKEFSVFLSTASKHGLHDTRCMSNDDHIHGSKDSLIEWFSAFENKPVGVELDFMSRMAHSSTNRPITGSSFADLLSSQASDVTVADSSVSLVHKSNSNQSLFIPSIQSSLHWANLYLGNEKLDKRIHHELIVGADFIVMLDVIEYDRGMHLLVTNNLGKVDVKLVLLKNNSENVFETETTIGVPILIPIDYSISQLCFIASSLWLIRSKFAEFEAVSYNRSVERSINSIKVASTKRGNTTQNESCESENGLHYVSHDLECTVPDIAADMLLFVGVVIPRDGKFEVWVPTLGRRPVDVQDCCKKHDVALWCARSRFYDENRPSLPHAQLADVQVVACILGKLYDVFASGGYLEDVANIAWFLLTYSYTAVLIHLGSCYSAAYHDASLLDLNGLHSQSCLCGGTEPTVQCNDKCRDLCKEFHKQMKCTNACSYSCEYDAYGRLQRDKPRRLVNSTN